MTLKQKTVLFCVIAFGIFIIFIFVPYVIITDPIEPVQNLKGIPQAMDRCPYCNSTEVYGGGFIQLEISEHDLGGRHIQPYRPIPVIACNNCGAVRLDLKRINFHPGVAMEMLDERPQD